MKISSARTGSKRPDTGQVRLEGPYTALASDPGTACGQRAKRKDTLPFMSSALQS